MLLAAVALVTYLRNPRSRILWESDGAPPWCKYRADDGTLHDSPNAADAHDREVHAAEVETTKQWIGMQGDIAPGGSLVFVHLFARMQQMIQGIEFTDEQGNLLLEMIKARMRRRPPIDPDP